MKKYAYLMLLLATVSCKNSDGALLSKYAIVKGNVYTDIKDNQININNEVVNVTADEGGSFSDTIYLSAPQYVQFSFENLSGRIYLTPVDEVKITVDTTISFSGSNSDINAYLLEYAQNDIERQEREYSKHEQIFTLSEAEYVKFRDSIRRQKLSQLNTLPSGTEEFQDFHSKDIEFQYQHDVARYPNYYSWFFKDYEPTDIITSFYEGVDLNNESYAQNYAGYRDLVDLVIEKQIQDLIEKGLSPLKANLTVLEDLNSPSILHRRLRRALNFFTSETKNIEATKNKMLSLAKKDQTKTMIIERYKVINRLKPGNPAPLFSLENYKEGSTNLADLKGKYVFIDVWATWCGPCIKEIPYLKKIEKEFEHSNISFVSISIDEPRFYDKWREMVKTQELTGVQLIVEEGWDSKFIKDYGIKAIPRFLLIDHEGNFVSADVERPSDPKLGERLRSLGI